MRSELRMLREAGILSDEQIEQTVRWAREATFVEG
jgi:adenosine deaminase